MKPHTLLISFLLMLAVGCSSAIPNRDPVGEMFPQVTGNALSGEQRTLPNDLGDKLAVLLVAYKQETQFDVDRWILGLVQLNTPATILEVPTVDGLIPGMIADKIDDGMRSGIPSEDWASVVTVYDDAEKLTTFTGTETPNNTRVMLVVEGKVVWFWDQGYSAGRVKKLDSAVRELLPSKQPEEGEAGEMTKAP